MLEPLATLNLAVEATRMSEPASSATPPPVLLRLPAMSMPSLPLAEGLALSTISPLAVTDELASRLIGLCDCKVTVPPVASMREPDRTIAPVLSMTILPFWLDTLPRLKLAAPDVLTRLILPLPALVALNPRTRLAPSRTVPPMLLVVSMPATIVSFWLIALPEVTLTLPPALRIAPSTIGPVLRSA